VTLTFEQWRGTWGPVPATPDRVHGSIRRATSIQTTWPNGVGLDSDVRLIARGRDVRTARDGATSVVDAAAVELSAQGIAHEVTQIESEPQRSELDALVGASLMGGFRKVAVTALPDVAGSVMGLLLDDLPAAMIVAASVPIRVLIEDSGEVPEWMRQPSTGSPYVCLGHRDGGVMQQRRMNGQPLLGQGPPAGDLRRPDDPFAWPDAPPTRPYSTRRLRRIDVRMDGDVLQVDSHFRDSYTGPDRVETSVHEYEVTLTAGTDDLVRSVEVRPRVLPGPECPTAAASAQRVVGQPLEQLRQFVRAELRGETVCPHLNDQLRALADVPDLARTLELHRP